jgi:hypothetical protein
MVRGALSNERPYRDDRCMSGLGLGRVKTQVPAARIENFEELRIMRVKSCCAHSVRYRAGELYFSDFTEP